MVNNKNIIKIYLKNIFKIKTSIYANTFIYYFKRIWLIGKILPDAIYSNMKLKNIISIIIAVFFQLCNILKKAVYLILMIWYPIMLSNKASLQSGEVIALFVNIFFYLSCILGALQDSEIFKITREKYVCLKYMKMNPKGYVFITMSTKYINHFVFYLPILITGLLMLGGTVYQAVVMWLALICFRFMGEALQLIVYDKKKIILSRNTGFVWVAIGIGLALAYVPLLVDEFFIITSVFFSLPFIILFIILGTLSFYYIYFGYKKYDIDIKQTLDANFLFSVAMENVQKSKFTDVAVKEKDLDILSEKDKNDYGKIEKMSGFSYLNAIFFKRHKRQIIKPVIIRILIIIILFAVGVIVQFIAPNIAIEIAKYLVSSLPMFVFIMYFMSTAEKACRAMFFNCDISLLRYGFYRQPKTVLQNFNVRLLRIVYYNLMIAAALSLAILAFAALCDINVLTIDIAMLVLAIILISIFFSVHHLFMYYIFQPYTTELDVKNPFFNIINSIVYFICFMCMQIETASSIFTLCVLAFTILYIAIALIIVYKKAPKTFRVK